MPLSVAARNIRSSHIDRDQGAASLPALKQRLASGSCARRSLGLR